jgi:hypothetical protein
MNGVSSIPDNITSELPHQQSKWRLSDTADVLLTT